MEHTTCFVPSQELLKKYEMLKTYLASLKKVAIAFSSGVDSTFLVYAAKEALPKDMIAVTARSASFPQRESEEAIRFCIEHQIPQRIVDFDEMNVDGFSANPPDRCYLCKKQLFSDMLLVASENDCTCLCEGSNLDDLGDYRPGLKAIEELGIISPLRVIGFTKEEIRILSRYLDLPTWRKPSFACLASRFPYGETITKEKLSMVDKGEQLLLSLGFEQFRVRIHGTIARIELLPEEFDKLMKDDIRLTVYQTFKELGFSYVALDLYGYRTGSMNETILGNAGKEKN